MGNFTVSEISEMENEREKSRDGKLSFSQKAERSISTKFRGRLWSPFISAIKRYRLICPGDRIAVCISGGKDSMLLATLMRMLHRYTEIPFDVEYLVMDPGYNEINLLKIEKNAELLEIPITIFKTDIFDVANKIEHSPCYICARMRRGHLYHQAKEMGCNKIALGHHFSDVIETTVMSMFYASQLQAMLPKLRSQNFEGMSLVRPLYLIHEEDIVAWAKANGLDFIRCACRFTENTSNGIGESKRREVKDLIRRLKKDNPNIEKSIFNSIHAVCIETFPGYRMDGVRHSFLERFDETESADFR